MIYGLHWLDIAILLLYFLIIIYVGIYRGGKSTNNLGDFFVAGGKWGAVVSFIFVFASALAGNEAVVVSGEAYDSGLSGVWYWWSFLIATPVYYLFSIYFKRARVYNICEFFEMRYDRYAAAIYSIFAAILSMILAGTFILAIGKILAGVTDFSTQQCVWAIAILVSAYVFSGGMMSALMTDLIQGVMTIVFLSFLLLPFLYTQIGGWEPIVEYSANNPGLWDFTSEGMTLGTVLALNFSALIGGLAFPAIFNWIAISKNEKAGTQCGWAHLWKRIVTLVFAVYGILFAIYHPGLADSEMAWGVVMNDIIPVGLLGLFIASFFAAAMSSADSSATISSAMIIDYFYRKIISPYKNYKTYLRSARFWAVLSIVIAALSTEYLTSIQQYIKLFMTLLSFLGIPIYFGVWWRKANKIGMRISILSGVTTYIATVVVVMVNQNLNFAEAIHPAFEPAVFLAGTVSVITMILGSIYGKPDDPLKVTRFYVIMNTPIGQEQQLADAGIRLPSMIDAGIVKNEPEQIDNEKIKRLYKEQSKEKFFGPDSNLEFREQRDFPGYWRGLGWITLGCVLLVVITWIIPRILFIW